MTGSLFSFRVVGVLAVLVHRELWWDTLDTNCPVTIEIRPVFDGD